MVAGTGWNRRAPAKLTGEARSPNTGSVRTRTPSDSMSRVLWPSQVMRRPAGETGLDQAGRGSSSGSGAGGTRERPPKMNSPITGRAGPFSPGPRPAVVFRNRPS